MAGFVALHETYQERLDAFARNIASRAREDKCDSGSYANDQKRQDVRAILRTCEAFAHDLRQALVALASAADGEKAFVLRIFVRLMERACSRSGYDFSGDGHPGNSSEDHFDRESDDLAGKEMHYSNHEELILSNDSLSRHLRQFLSCEANLGGLRCIAKHMSAHFPDDTHEFESQKSAVDVVTSWLERGPNHILILAALLRRLPQENQPLLLLRLSRREKHVLWKHLEDSRMCGSCYYGDRLPKEWAIAAHEVMADTFLALMKIWYDGWAEKFEHFSPGKWFDVSLLDAGKFVPWYQMRRELATLSTSVSFKDATVQLGKSENGQLVPQLLKYKFSWPFSCSDQKYESGALTAWVYRLGVLVREVPDLFERDDDVDESQHLVQQIAGDMPSLLGRCLDVLTPNSTKTLVRILSKNHTHFFPGDGADLNELSLASLLKCIVPDSDACPTVSALATDSEDAMILLERIIDQSGARLFETHPPTHRDDAREAATYLSCLSWSIAMCSSASHAYLKARSSAGAVLKKWFGVLSFLTLLAREEGDEKRTGLFIILRQYVQLMGEVRQCIMDWQYSNPFYALQGFQPTDLSQISRTCEIMVGLKDGAAYSYFAMASFFALCSKYNMALDQAISIVENIAGFWITNTSKKFLGASIYDHGEFLLWCLLWHLEKSKIKLIDQVDAKCIANRVREDALWMPYVEEKSWERRMNDAFGFSVEDLFISIEQAAYVRSELVSKFVVDQTDTAGGDDDGDSNGIPECHGANIHNYLFRIYMAQCSDELRSTADDNCQPFKSLWDTAALISQFPIALLPVFAAVTTPLRRHLEFQEVRDRLSCKNLQEKIKETQFSIESQPHTMPVENRRYVNAVENVSDTDLGLLERILDCVKESQSQLEFSLFENFWGKRDCHLKGCGLSDIERKGKIFDICRKVCLWHNGNSYAICAEPFESPKKNQKSDVSENELNGPSSSTVFAIVSMVVHIILGCSTNMDKFIAMVLGEYAAELKLVVDCKQLWQTCQEPQVLSYVLVAIRKHGFLMTVPKLSPSATASDGTHGKTGLPMGPVITTQAEQDIYLLSLLDSVGFHEKEFLCKLLTQWSPERTKELCDFWLQCVEDNAAGDAAQYQIQSFASKKGLSVRASLKAIHHRVMISDKFSDIMGVIRLVLAPQKNVGHQNRCINRRQSEDEILCKATIEACADIVEGAHKEGAWSSLWETLQCKIPKERVALEKLNKEERGEARIWTRVWWLKLLVQTTGKIRPYANAFGLCIEAKAGERQSFDLDLERLLELLFVLYDHPSGQHNSYRRHSPKGDIITTLKTWHDEDAASFSQRYGALKSAGIVGERQQAEMKSLNRVCVELLAFLFRNNFPTASYQFRRLTDTFHKKSITELEEALSWFSTVLPPSWTQSNIICGSFIQFVTEVCTKEAQGHCHDILATQKCMETRKLLLTEFGPYIFHSSKFCAGAREHLLALLQRFSDNFERKDGTVSCNRNEDWELFWCIISVFQDHLEEFGSGVDLLVEVLLTCQELDSLWHIILGYTSYDRPEVCLAQHLLQVLYNLEQDEVVDRNLKVPNMVNCREASQSLLREVAHWFGAHKKRMSPSSDLCRKFFTASPTASAMHFIYKFLFVKVHLQFQNEPEICKKNADFQVHYPEALPKLDALVIDFNDWVELYFPTSSSGVDDGLNLHSLGNALKPTCRLGGHVSVFNGNGDLLQALTDSDFFQTAIVPRIEVMIQIVEFSCTNSYEDQVCAMTGAKALETRWAYCLSELATKDKSSSLIIVYREWSKFIARLQLPAADDRYYYDESDTLSAQKILSVLKELFQRLSSTTLTFLPRCFEEIAGFPDDDESSLLPLTSTFINFISTIAECSFIDGQPPEVLHAIIDRLLKLRKGFEAAESDLLSWGKHICTVLVLLLPIDPKKSLDLNSFNKACDLIEAVLMESIKLKRHSAFREKGCNLAETVFYWSRNTSVIWEVANTRTESQRLFDWLESIVNVAQVLEQKIVGAPSTAADETKHLWLTILINSVLFEFCGTLIEDNMHKMYIFLSEDHQIKDEEMIEFSSFSSRMKSYNAESLLIQYIQKHYQVLCTHCDWEENRFGGYSRVLKDKELVPHNIVAGVAQACNDLSILGSPVSSGITSRGISLKCMLVALGKRFLTRRNHAIDTKRSDLQMASESCDKARICVETLSDLILSLSAVKTSWILWREADMLEHIVDILQYLLHNNQMEAVLQNDPTRHGLVAALQCFYQTEWSASNIKILHQLEDKILQNLDSLLCLKQKLSMEFQFLLADILVSQEFSSTLVTKGFCMLHATGHFNAEEDELRPPAHSRNYVDAEYFMFAHAPKGYRDTGYWQLWRCLLNAARARRREIALKEETTGEKVLAEKSDLEKDLPKVSNALQVIQKDMSELNFLKLVRGPESIPKVEPILGPDSDSDSDSSTLSSDTLPRFTKRRRIQHPSIMVRRRKFRRQEDPEHYSRKDRIAAYLKYHLQNHSHCARHLPIPVFIPDSSLIFRGLGNRDGPKLLERSIRDLLQYGVRHVDWTVSSATGQTWAKCGQFFATPVLDLAAAYADCSNKSNGSSSAALCAIRSEYANQIIAAGRGRWERESQIQIVFYDPIPLDAVEFVVLTSDWKKQVQAAMEEVQTKAKCSAHEHGVTALCADKTSDANDSDPHAHSISIGSRNRMRIMKKWAEGRIFFAEETDKSLVGKVKEVAKEKGMTLSTEEDVLYETYQVMESVNKE